MNTLEKVISIIRENKIPCPEITPETNLYNDLGFDSFDALMIINALEDEFAIRFKNADLNNLQTVENIARLIDEKYQKKAT